MKEKQKVKKITILLEIARLVSEHQFLTVNQIHSAGGRFCVSGDRRLRQLKAMFWVHIQSCEKAYTYVPTKPKGYIFTIAFRHFCQMFVATHGLETATPDVRVQTPPGGRTLALKGKPIIIGTCALCGAYMRRYTNRKNRRFCSAKCRIAAWRLLHGEKK